MPHRDRRRPGASLATDYPLGRSGLSQQALIDLPEACGGDPRERRRQVLVELAAWAEERGGTAFEPPQEALIREDSER